MNPTAVLSTAAVPTADWWHLLVEPQGAPGPVNMAVDQDLLSRAAVSSTSTLRLYRFNPRCLSFGRNEAANEHYDRARIERLGIDVVRRPTGGGAVWHEHEVTYAVAAPIAAFGSLREAYCAIHQRIAAGLRTLGVEAALAPRSQPRPELRGSCFAAAAGGEILVHGRKLVGSAQVRLRDAFLQHGSILLETRSNEFAPFDGATSLSEVLGRSVGFDEVAAAIVDAWSPTTPASPALTVPTAQFLSSPWTWRR